MQPAALATEHTEQAERIEPARRTGHVEPMPPVAPTDDTRANRPARVHRGRARGTVAALVGWVVLLVVVNRWGQALLDRGVETRILAPPLIGRFQLGPDRGLDALALLAPLVAGLVVAAVPAVDRLSWRRLCWTAAAGAGVFAVALALVSGWYWLQRPMELPGHYLLDVDLVGAPGALLRDFTDRIDAFGTHVRGHPPGFLLLLFGLDRFGFAGSGWAAALAIAGGAASVPAVLVAIREVAGEAWARRAAPFLVLAPTALYVATTADAFFAGVGAWAVTAGVVATGRTGRRRDVLAVVAGAGFAVTAMCSYGLVLLGAVPLAVAWTRRAWRPLAIAGATAAALLVALWAATGFSWIEGLLATRVEYLESVARVRPYGYFLLANLAAFALVVGPATVVALATGRLRTAGLWLLVGGGLAAVALADVSGMSKGEVERIWLPFAFWVLPAAAAVARPGDVAGVRRWLTLQAGVAYAVQVGVRTHW